MKLLEKILVVTSLFSCGLILLQWNYFQFFMEYFPVITIPLTDEFNYENNTHFIYISLEVFLIISMLLLSMFYVFLGKAMFENFNIKSLLQNNTNQEIDKNRRILSLITGFVLCVSILGILFKMLSYPGGTSMLYMGILGSGIVAVMSYVKIENKSDGFYASVMKRVVPIAVVLLLFIVPSKESWSHFKYPERKVFTEYSCQICLQADKLYEEVKKEIELKSAMAQIMAHGEVGLGEKYSEVVQKEKDQKLKSENQEALYLNLWPNYDSIIWVMNIRSRNYFLYMQQEDYDYLLPHEKPWQFDVWVANTECLQLHSFPMEDKNLRLELLLRYYIYDNLTCYYSDIRTEAKQIEDGLYLSYQGGVQKTIEQEVYDKIIAAQEMLYPKIDDHIENYKDELVQKIAGKDSGELSEIELVMLKSHAYKAYYNKVNNEDEMINPREFLMSFIKKDTGLEKITQQLDSYGRGVDFHLPGKVAAETTASYSKTLKSHR